VGDECRLTHSKEPTKISHVDGKTGDGTAL